MIGLIPARTDTRWWHDHVAGLAHAWLLRGRLAFGDGTAPAPFPSAVVLWGGDVATIAKLSAAVREAHHVPPGGRSDRGTMPATSLGTPAHECISALDV